MRSQPRRVKTEVWIAISLEEGVRFFITSLGNPRWVVDRVRPLGGVVYHDVTERKWALKGRDGGVDGLIAVNNRAGGHAGPLGARALLDSLGDLGSTGVGYAERVAMLAAAIVAMDAVGKLTDSQALDAAFIVRSGVLPEIVERLNREVVRIIGLPEVRLVLTEQGYEPIGSPPDVRQVHPTLSASFCTRTASWSWWSAARST